MYFFTKLLFPNNLKLKSIMRFPILFSLLLVFLAIVSCKNSESQEIFISGEEQISYNFHIRPILSDKCFACHGPDANKREAGLRLDIAEGAYAALQESPGQHAIVPNKPEESQVFLRISTEEPGVGIPGNIHPQSSHFLSVSFLRK